MDLLSLLWKSRRPDPNYNPKLDIGIGRRGDARDDFAFALPFPSTLHPHGITRVAVMAHVFYLDVCDELLVALYHIPVQADLFVSTDTEEKRQQIARKLAGYANGTVTIRVFPNRGRDIAPKLTGFADVYPRYDYFLHIHTKKTLFDDKLSGWRPYLYHNLIGSREIINSILTLLERDEIGAVFPQHYPLTRPAVHWAHSFPRARELLKQSGIALRQSMPLEFPSGSMFWGKTAAFRLLLDRKLDFADFEEEAGQTDGTLAHAVEHSFLHFVEAAGYHWAKIGTEATYCHPDTLLPVKHDEDITTHLKKVHRPLLLETPDPEAGIGRRHVREVHEIEYKILKSLSDVTGQEIVLLTTYHPTGKLSRHVRHLLAAYHAAELKVLLLSVVDSLEKAEVSPLDDLEGHILRANHGYDFSTWAHALRLFPQLDKARTLFFANDSVFGPLDQKDFLAVIEKIRASNADLVALTDSLEISPHFQSYFFALKNRAFSKIKPFWEKVRSFPHKKTVISQYEFAFQPFATEHGVECEALFPVAKIKGHSFRGNPTLLLWKKLIDRGFPFVKVQLVRDNLQGTSTAGLEKILQRKGYDPTIIDDHLASGR
jgi:lipopolysaccharide biosynthesis protein